MDGVGQYLPSDRHALVDRRTAYYADAASLAKQLMAGTGRTLEAGARKSWTFLMRTPDVIEAGVRRVLAEGCPGISVAKRSVGLGGTTRTVNPDIVVNHDHAVADIKYKLADNDRKRADLYEVVAFAAALRTEQAALINFRVAGTCLPAVGVGDIEVSELSWLVGQSTSPHHAAQALAEDFQQWVAAGDP
jgi:hypothetical protein